MRSNWSPICLLVIEQSNYYKKFDNNKKKITAPIHDEMWENPLCLGAQ
jgi:hypothetical protein